MHLNTRDPDPWVPPGTPYAGVLFAYESYRVRSCSGLFCLCRYVGLCLRLYRYLSVSVRAVVIGLYLVLLSVFVDRCLVSAYVSLSTCCQWVFICLYRLVSVVGLLYNREEVVRR